MTIFLTVHSLVRWIIMLVAVALIARLAIGLLKKQAFDKTARILTAAFSGLMDTQMLLGILLFVIDGLTGSGFPAYRWAHALTMVVAVVAAHLPSAWKKAEDGIRTRNTLIAVAASLLIVLVGIVIVEVR
ncbi:MAG: hypothetical protein WA821_02075 [Anaerolineales bacterium]